MRHGCRWIAAGMLAMVVGCGSQIAMQAEFEYALRDPDGNVLVLDDLREIAVDEDLTEDEKRAAFQALGIEDEDLIDALLTLE